MSVAPAIAANAATHDVEATTFGVPSSSGAAVSGAADDAGATDAAVSGSDAASSLPHAPNNDVTASSPAARAVFLNTMTSISPDRTPSVRLHQERSPDRPPQFPTSRASH